MIVVSQCYKHVRDDHGYGNYDVGGYSGSSMMASHQSWGNTGPDVGGSIHSQHNYGGPGSGGSGAGPGGHRYVIFFIKASFSVLLYFTIFSL